jgi:YfiR/HmsC-like
VTNGLPSRGTLTAGIQPGRSRFRKFPARLGSSRRACWELAQSLTLALVLITASIAAAQEIDEDHFEAAFLFNVAQFVEWPQGAFQGSGDPVVGCILGESPLGSLLEGAASSNLVGGRKFVVRRITNVQNSNGCHILFASSSEQKHWRSILDGSKNKGVLTVGETEGFAAQGGVANFKREGDRIRIQINLEAAADQKLRISSKLLALSQIVKKVR